CASGQDAVADLHGVTVAQLEVWQRFRSVQTDNRQIVEPIALDILRDELAPVAELHLDRLGAGDDVVIGEDDPLRIDEEAGTKAALGEFVRHLKLPWFEVVEEPTKFVGEGERIVAGGPATMRS